MTPPSIAEVCELHAAGHEAKVRHGTHYECVALAAALGLPSGAISFDYCRNILQHRWSMTCMHGVVEETDDPPRAYEKWKNKGEMNPILAILVENA